MKSSLHELHYLLVQAEKDMGLSGSMRRDVLAINVKGKNKFKRNAGDIGGGLKSVRKLNKGDVDLRMGNGSKVVVVSVGTYESRAEKIIIGKIWASKAINIRAAIDTMLRIWNPVGRVMGNVLDTKERIFIFRFEDERDKIKVLEGQPWHFDKYALCFNESNGEEKMTDTPLFYLPIRARIYDLPIKGRINEDNLSRLGSQLGSYVGRDDSAFPEMERAVRIRVLHDVRKPLRSSVEIRMPNGKVTAFDVKYERMPMFCYGCGVLGHGAKDCEDGPYEEEELRFGDKLRASPWRGGKAGVTEGKKTSRDLRPEFEEEYRRSEKEMIEKLQRFALSNTQKVRLGKTRVELGSIVDEEAGLVSSGFVGTDKASLGEGQNRVTQGTPSTALVMTDEEETEVRKGNVEERCSEGGTDMVVVGAGVDVGLNGGGVVSRYGKKWQRILRQEGGNSVNAEQVLTNSMLNENQKRIRGDDEGGKTNVSKKSLIHRDVTMGAGNPAAVGGLRNLLRRKAASIVFLCETKLSSKEMQGVWGKFDGFTGVAVDSMGRSGGLAMLWRSNITCTLRSASVHYMDFDVEFDGEKCRITGFYGWPAIQDRHLSWQQLRILASQSQEPWLCVGDYNEIMYSTEMKGGSRAQWQMNNFRDAIDDCGLRDLPYEGYEFTFDNGQAGDDNRQCRIDRAMGTDLWFDKFPYARLVHLDREWSDHAPLKVVFDKCVSEASGLRRRFRFEHIWVGEEGCEDAIRRCAQELQKWKGLNIGKIVRDINAKRRRLRELNESTRSVRLVRERQGLVRDIAKLIRQEELFWRQRSRAIWLKDGDKNTKFFHRKATQRKQRNYIGRLVDDNGGVRVTTGAIADGALCYFSNLFASSGPEEFDGLLSGVEGRVTEQMNNILRANYTEVEIVEALNQMHPLKAPGPDGMNALFFQTYWHIVGPSVIVSKVLANRLKQFLGDIVSENQSAFTSGRLITDNILLAFEMFHYMKNSRGGGGHMALKLDMSKAYDRVEWVFLEKVLLRMGFDGVWVDRVMNCVRTVSYEVVVNGELSNPIYPGRGLRQGDPISPYLFILCAEVLSSLMKRAVEAGTLHGIRIAPTAPVISHLLFADDSIFFVKAAESEARKVMDILAQYERASGQVINFDKTTVSFSKGTRGDRKERVVAVLGVRVVGVQDRYLGLPTIVGHSKHVISKVIRDKLSKKLQGWRGLLLSKAGREVVIKAVAQSIPTYAMSVFKLPANFCDELRSLVSGFWWGADRGKRKLAWVAWDRLCLPKSRGELGFRDFNRFNIALLGKQAWRLMTESESLMVRVLKAKYFPSTSFMEAELGVAPSYTWKSIWEARDVVKLGA
ncbi:uncharacterized protein LOC141655729 [Silene latifolia]|uniref:uncharacterized protein LOC141655729 n=1 Tax=Silene latifolia TaxID=37657 RepID=UPI003D77CCBD